MTYADDGKKNWTELKAKMAAGGMPTQADQLGALHAFARIFRDKGPLSDLLSEDLLDWFEAKMDLGEKSDVFAALVHEETVREGAERLLSSERDRVDTLACHIVDLRQSVKARDSEITALLDQQDGHDAYAKAFYRLVVTWAANGHITQDMLIDALTLKGA